MVRRKGRVYIVCQKDPKHKQVRPAESVPTSSPERGSLESLVLHDLHRDKGEQAQEQCAAFKSFGLVKVAPMVLCLSSRGLSKQAEANALALAFNASRTHLFPLCVRATRSFTCIQTLIAIQSICPLFLASISLAAQQRNHCRLRAKGRMKKPRVLRATGGHIEHIQDMCYVMILNVFVCACCDENVRAWSYKEC